MSSEVTLLFAVYPADYFSSSHREKYHSEPQSKILSARFALEPQAVIHKGGHCARFL